MTMSSFKVNLVPINYKLVHNFKFVDKKVMCLFSVKNIFFLFSILFLFYEELENTSVDTFEKLVIYREL